MNSPVVTVGIPLYNHADWLAETLESLLTQTFPDCRFIAVDDCSTDDSRQVVESYVAIDGRLSYECNSRRLGMIGNWRRCFEVARERYPNARYFAWASDHDLYHPRALEELVGQLDNHPEAVLAYSSHLKISETGEPRGQGGWKFDTAGITSRNKRFVETTWRMSAGNMIYGLFRSDALLKAGVFRKILLPDRFLIAEISLQGEFRQVRELLWYRRHEGVFSLGRQRQSLFGLKQPWWARIPWWISQPKALGWNLCVRGTGRPKVSRLYGFFYAYEYFFVSTILHFARGIRRFQKRHLPRYIDRAKEFFSGRSRDTAAGD